MTSQITVFPSVIHQPHSIPYLSLPPRVHRGFMAGDKGCEARWPGKIWWEAERTNEESGDLSPSKRCHTESEYLVDIGSLPPVERNALPYNFDLCKHNRYDPVVYSCISYIPHGMCKVSPWRVMVLWKVL